MKGDPKDLGFSTRAIHAGQPPEPVTGAVTVPIFQTATYVLEEVGRDKGFDYTRSSNPPRQILEENLAAIEGGLAEQLVQPDSRHTSWPAQVPCALLL